MIRVRVMLMLVLLLHCRDVLIGARSVHHQVDAGAELVLGGGAHGHGGLRLGRRVLGDHPEGLLVAVQLGDLRRRPAQLVGGLDFNAIRN